jgi:hypothetical protein
MKIRDFGWDKEKHNTMEFNNVVKESSTKPNRVTKVKRGRTQVD